MKTKNRVQARERREAILNTKRKHEKDAYLNQKEENAKLLEEMEKAQLRLIEIKEKRAQQIKLAMSKQHQKQ